MLSAVSQLDAESELFAFISVETGTNLEARSAFLAWLSSIICYGHLWSGKVEWHGGTSISIITSKVSPVCGFLLSRLIISKSESHVVAGNRLRLAHSLDWRGYSAKVNTTKTRWSSSRGTREHVIKIEKTSNRLCYRLGLLLSCSLLNRLIDNFD